MKFYSVFILACTLSLKTALGMEANNKNIDVEVQLKKRIFKLNKDVKFPNDAYYYRGMYDVSSHVSGGAPLPILPIYPHLPKEISFEEMGFMCDQGFYSDPSHLIRFVPGEGIYAPEDCYSTKPELVPETEKHEPIGCVKYGEEHVFYLFKMPQETQKFFVIGLAFTKSRYYLTRKSSSFVGDLLDLELNLPEEFLTIEESGFKVGGRNESSFIKNLTSLNGISIKKLEKLMRPGACSHKQEEHALSQTFAKWKESSDLYDAFMSTSHLLEVLNKDGPGVIIENLRKIDRYWEQFLITNKATTRFSPLKYFYKFNQGISSSGFLNAEDHLLEVLSKDNDFVLSQGLTHTQMAYPLRLIIEADKQDLISDNAFLFGGKPFYVKTLEWKGCQKSPFNQTNAEKRLTEFEYKQDRKALIHTFQEWAKDPFYIPYMKSLLEEYGSGFYEGIYDEKDLEKIFDELKLLEVTEWWQLEYWLKNPTDVRIFLKAFADEYLEFVQENCKEEAKPFDPIEYFDAFSDNCVELKELRAEAEKERETHHSSDKDFLIYNLEDGTGLHVGKLLYHLIRDYGFYENTEYRVAPEQLLKVFGPIYQKKFGWHKK
jgi:hypothetical protein